MVGTTHKFIRVNNIADKNTYNLNEAIKLSPRVIDHLRKPKSRAWETWLWVTGQESGRDSQNNIGIVTALWWLLKTRPYAEESTHFRRRTWTNWIARDLEDPSLALVLTVIKGAMQTQREKKQSMVWTQLSRTTTTTMARMKMSLRVHGGTFISVVTNSRLLGLKAHYIKGGNLPSVL